VPQDADVVRVAVGVTDAVVDGSSAARLVAPPPPIASCIRVNPPPQAVTPPDAVLEAANAHTTSLALVSVPLAVHAGVADEPVTSATSTSCA
jgi:hypothetical protein